MMGNHIFENSCPNGSQLLHYTSLSALKSILSDHTLLCNSLENVNDLLEKKRSGIEAFASTKFISSFCHSQYEMVPFWFMYGGNKREEKVLLRLQAFPSELQDIFEIDYVLDEKKQEKIYFLDNKDYVSANSRKGVCKVKLFDVDYRKPDDEVFSKEYREISYFSMEEKPVVGKPAMNTNVRWDTRSLGKYKTIHWKYEEETRLLCTSNLRKKIESKFIFLRLKDKFFENMVIVTNPWAKDKFIMELKSFIENTNLSGNIKKTITIEKSDLHGQIV